MSNLSNKSKAEIAVYKPEHFAVQRLTKKMKDVTSPQILYKLEEMPSLVRLAKKDLTENDVLVIICNFIQDAVDFAGGKEKMTKNQILQAAELFYQKAKFIKISELEYFFRGVKIGDYGQIYGDLTGAKIMYMLNTYLKQRDDYFETALEVESSMNKGDLRTKVNSVNYGNFKKNNECNIFSASRH